MNEDKKVIAVGTTAMRTLESLYWLGAKIVNGTGQNFTISQNDPYNADLKSLPSKIEALKAVEAVMPEQNPLIGHTSIYMVPGYTFRICEGLITNFHQPGSTLMLLVAAFIGPAWRTVYEEALAHDYRFLSYGDGSLLLPS